MVAKTGAWVVDLEGEFGPPLGSPFRISLGDAASVVIGRHPSCGLSGAAEGMSRIHARIDRDANGVWRLTDLGSAAGTFIDGQQRERAFALADGAVIHVGMSGRLRFGVGAVDDVAGAGCSVGGRYLFARTWPSSRSFQSVVVEGDAVSLRAASFVPRDLARVFATSRSILSDDGVRMLVESPDADGPTLLHIANATKELAATIDDEVLGAVVAALPGYANDLSDVAVTWNGDVAILGVPELRTQMQHRDWFALRLRELGYGVAHWHTRTPRELDADRAMLAGFVQRLFPDDARRARDRRDQILLRSAEDWRTAITRWRL